jgi:hypothetical protein
MVPDPNFDNIMKLYCFKDFRRFPPRAYESKAAKNNKDPWWQFCDAVAEFNNNRKTKLNLPWWLTADESMSPWKPRLSATGGLPNISFILRKPKPLGKLFWLLVFIFFPFSLTFFFCYFLFLFIYFFSGTEMKTVACPKTGVMLHLEIQRGKEGMKGSRHNASMGATAGCTLRLLEDTATGQPCKGIKADAWFGSVVAASQLAVRGFEAVLQIKTNSGFYPKAFITEQLKNAPGGGQDCNEGYCYKRNIAHCHWISLQCKENALFCYDFQGRHYKARLPL